MALEWLAFEWLAFEWQSMRTAFAWTSSNSNSSRNRSTTPLRSTIFRLGLTTTNTVPAMAAQLDVSAREQMRIRNTA